MGQCKIKGDINLINSDVSELFPKKQELRYFTCYINEISFLHSTITQLTTKFHFFYERDVSDPWFKFGSHIFRCVQADAIIIKLGLNCTHCTGPTCPPFNTHTL